MGRIVGRELGVRRVRVRIVCSVGGGMMVD